MQSKKFQRRIEDFECENCGAKVKGNGYTDHCPVCLWGKHMDIYPGDRVNICHGMMKPVRVIKKGDGYVIEYRCMKCEHQFRVKLAQNDNFEALIRITRN
ncbi:MAG: hypothetical protein A3J76_02810 [Candidatus Moranbacteria bacterium RBG_13_45_13]|nr:MAG: hypothetical protein A3J76_02810 [Candidatus Moranbacteria bacterium RBG_13_45_13]